MRSIQLLFQGQRPSHPTLDSPRAPIQAPHIPVTQLKPYGYQRGPLASTMGSRRAKRGLLGRTTRSDSRFTAQPTVGGVKLGLAELKGPYSRAKMTGETPPGQGCSLAMCAPMLTARPISPPRGGGCALAPRTHAPRTLRPTIFPPHTPTGTVRGPRTPGERPQRSLNRASDIPRFSTTREGG